MRSRRTPQSISTIGTCFRDVLAPLGGLTLPRDIAPAPVPGRRRALSGPTRQTAPGRPTGWLPLLVGLALLVSRPAWAGQPALPAGVPNLYDAEVRAHFQPVAMVNLRGNPDFPTVLVVNTSGEQPSALLLGLDARNGQDTWSLTADPLILIVVFADEATIQGVYVDTGFAALGRASGTYTAVGPGNSPPLLDLLNAVTAPGTRTDI